LRIASGYTFTVCATKGSWNRIDTQLPATRPALGPEQASNSNWKYRYKGIGSAMSLRWDTDRVPDYYRRKPVRFASELKDSIAANANYGKFFCKINSY
jgi:hypothetical protein